MNTTIARAHRRYCYNRLLSLHRLLCHRVSLHRKGVRTELQRRRQPERHTEECDPICSCFPSFGLAAARGRLPNVKKPKNANTPSIAPNTTIASPAPKNPAPTSEILSCPPTAADAALAGCE